MSPVGVPLRGLRGPVPPGFLADRVLTSPALGRGALGGRRLSYGLFYFQIGAATSLYNTFRWKPASGGAGDFVFPVGTIPADQWGLFMLSIDDTFPNANSGIQHIASAAANYTVGYPSEAAAIAALPATPVNQALMGYVTIKTAAGLPWVATADSLQGGSVGNIASVTNYYNAGPTI